VTIVGSDEWIAIVLEEFMTVVKTVCNVIGERVVLLQSTTEEEQGTGTVSVEEIASNVIRAVKEDGATHISLSLLLHRDVKLRNLLGGRDLIQLKEEYGHLFKDVCIFERDHEVYLENPCPREGRMLVDETGLFSVASSKWANALANIMAKHTFSVLCKDAMETVAIDLTASVGGLTLSLAKKFKRCIAIEIDPVRADLCRQNMQMHGCTNVHVRCQDSREAIPEMVQELKHEQSKEKDKIFILDPPWGGKYYKKEKDKKQPIMMGCWTVVQVVERIFHYMAPTVIGIRMPVDFDSASFLKDLDNAHVTFQVKEQKKLGPQLFIVLAV
jgi:predicted RNA methylase